MTRARPAVGLMARRRALIGRTVRLLVETRTRGGVVYPRGTRFVVVSVKRGATPLILRHAADDGRYLITSEESVEVLPPEAAPAPSNPR